MAKIKAPLIRACYFWWIILLAILFALWLWVGTPYIRWSYSWIDSGQGYSPYADRYYTKCRYLKLSDVSATHTLHNPNNGKCRWVLFADKRALWQE